jgi:hypothetical protein
MVIETLKAEELGLHEIAFASDNTEARIGCCLYEREKKDETERERLWQGNT